ncbi:hypothetical protein Poly24_54600 [Rosistilla carotiformis]|uniref:Ancillary SecYEG translocon subunit/Cell division coordinator CpoB TPR domain-containing protein n=1 Tax=Rosistilla carotiformis TaxID=2528017 RepID=A0A518K1N6_9BACT|nr:tetratricopeptide repeat protein [Rosistilla carotiformis]QDV71721.1 hypothetical protein Poly24_54600 [Rosistilla carotiformis]
MKSEHRHELQQNELADALGSGIHTITPYLRAIVIGVIGLIVIVFAYNFVSMRNQAHDATASLDFLLATSNEDPESFKRVSQDFADTMPGQWAQIAQADHNLGAGIESMFVDRDEATGFLEAATENYKSVLATAKDPLLKTRANLGLAKAYEAQGDLDQAIATYEIVADNTSSEALAEQAKERIRLLGTDDVRDFYTWFRENQPVAMASIAPGLPGLEDLPDGPTEGLPPAETPDLKDVEVSDAPEAEVKEEAAAAPKEDAAEAKEEAAEEPAKTE